MRKIFVMGECVMDFVKDAGAGGTAYRRAPGGCAFNVSAELARLARRYGKRAGVMPFIVARVGGDAYGRALSRALERRGVNTLYLRTDAAPTSRVYMDICADGQRRCAGRENGADANLCAADAAGITLERGDAFCFTGGGFLGEGCRAAHMLMLEKALKAGALVCFDLNIREGLWGAGKAEELLPPVALKSDIIKINGREIEKLFGADGIESLFKAFKDKFTALCTDGGRTKLYRREGRGCAVTVKALPCGARGGVGAGDRLFAKTVFWETAGLR